MDSKKRGQDMKTTDQIVEEIRLRLLLLEAARGLVVVAESLLDGIDEPWKSQAAALQKPLMDRYKGIIAEAEAKL